MIGPHEGKELELMLARVKPFAAFGDVVPEIGTIPEEIIPEKAFSPYVEQGNILRFSRDIAGNKTDEIMRYVCFCLPGEQWRADTYFWLRENMRNGKFPDDHACDRIIGRLLGYGEADIEEFVGQT
jgi:hypothetical protein